MKTLKLTINKEWFDLIQKGIKTEEYREIKPYYFSRLLYKIAHPIGGYFCAKSDILNNDFECKKWKKITGGAPIFEKFDLVQFINGYSKTSPKITLECKGISIGEGQESWGAEKNKSYFIIKLGNQIIQSPTIKSTYRTIEENQKIASISRPPKKVERQTGEKIHRIHIHLT